MASAMPTAPSIRIGISSCLLGQSVRYDGGHKHNEYLTCTLGRYFEFVSFCPEVAIGLGVPRRPIRLIGSQDGVHVQQVDDPSVDVTDALRTYALQVAAESKRLCGYVLKKGSPSCGMERVKIYSSEGVPVGHEAGMYARTLMNALPYLPVEEEGRLMDPVLRENFIERVFVLHRWQQLMGETLMPAKLVEFHTDHKFAILAHDEQAYRELGRMVSAAGGDDRRELTQRYLTALMQALKKPATKTRHANVLMHMFGFLKSHLSAPDKSELLELIDVYRRGLMPLVVPITLLKHHLMHFPDAYILRQTYLNPHPAELMLRNGL